VSRVGFGGATAGLRNYLGRFNPQAPEARESVMAAVRTALAVGINYFDTAPGYGAGLSEEILGEALAGVGDGAFLATKVSLRDRGDVRRSVEASLRRLRRSRIDLLQIHGTSYGREEAESILAPGGMLDQMEALQSEGIVRWLGFTSEDNNSAVYRFMESGRFQVVQLMYNFLSQHPYNPARPFGSMLQAERGGLGIVAMRVPTSGSFQKWIRLVKPNDTFDYTRALIQFVLSNPLVDVALVGMRSAGRVRQNAAIADDAAGRIDIGALYRWYVE
jgi:hypothetical protein